MSNNRQELTSVIVDNKKVMYFKHSPRQIFSVCSLSKRKKPRYVWMNKTKWKEFYKKYLIAIGEDKGWMENK